MLAPGLKADIRRLWDRFWSGGIANPLTAIEQITYLVFLKRLDDLDHQQAREDREAGRRHSSVFDVPNGETYRWGYIKQLPSEDRLRHVRGPVFEWLKTIPGAEERMRDAVFVIPSANLLQGAIEIIDELFVPSRNQDTLGDIYEMLLAEIAEAGKNGQFRTPRHIIRAMCDLVDPKLGERICDPACGTAGFLVNAYQHILKCNTNSESLKFEADGSPLDYYGDLLTPEQHEALRRNHFYGFDFDRTMVRLGWMNMIQHGLGWVDAAEGRVDSPHISYADTLGSRFNERVTSGEIGDFDVVLANPPFTGSIDKSDIGASLRSLNTTKTELLFIDLILDLLRLGGRSAVIVPEGVLFGSTKAHKDLREKLVTKNTLHAVISLPGGVFQPYTGVKTSILMFTKGGKTENVWFYEVSADGYALNAKRTEQPERNDLWNMTLKYSLRFHQSPPAFIDGEAWEQWRQMGDEERSHRYAQPIIATEQRVVDDDIAATGQAPLYYEPERIEVKLYTGIETKELAEANDWTASREQVAEDDYNLSAGRYKPLALAATEHAPPADIIRQLQELEGQIQAGLSRLEAMVAGRE